MFRPILIASAAALALAACNNASEDTADTTGTTTTDPMAPADDMAMDDTMAGDTAMGPAAGPAVPGAEYAEMAAASDMFEIESSQLALENAQSQEVRDFAQMMVDDHTKSTEALRTAAGETQPPITVEPALNPQQQQNMEALQGAAEGEFDQLYLTQQVAAHEQALQLLQSYAEGGDMPPLQQHAQTTAPVVEQHLQRVQELQGSVGAGAETPPAEEPPVE